MYIIKVLLCIDVAYFMGSISFAILISRWVKGVDIRTIGNKNPGTSNVGREIGKGWAALVFLGDMAKGLVPLLLARTIIFNEEDLRSFIPLLLMGIAAICGHCWPVYHGFKGGRGLATSIGVYLFFIPAEFFADLIISFLLIMIFLRKKRYAVGQLTPFSFVTLAPLLLWISQRYIHTEFGPLRIGAYPDYVLAGITLLSLFLIILNIRVVKDRLSPGS